MKTINEAAESAAANLLQNYIILLDSPFSDTIAPRQELSELIARHFSDYAALRDAADRVLEIGECVQGDYDPGPIPGHAPTERDYLYCDFDVALTALRGLLNTQPTKETL